MKRIYINPGHSDKDPGAVGYETERMLNVKVSRYMSEYLTANYECEVKMNPGTMDSLTDICNDANNWGADLFVSIHFNAGGGDGYEALVYGKNRVSLGKVFEKYVRDAGQNIRGVKFRPDLSVLKNTCMAAIVNEGAFVDNKTDISDWDDNFELQKLGEAYAKSAAEFLCLKEKYTFFDFVWELQNALGAIVTGEADAETLHKTVTLSAHKNHTHPAVLPMQKWLRAMGYDEVGNPDGTAGRKFTTAIEHFQRDNDCYEDGEIAEWGKTWCKILKME